MSEILRKKLASRLQADTFAKSRDRTPTGERVKLVPSLQLDQTRSLSTLKKLEKLKPISPFLPNKLEGTYTERPTGSTTPILLRDHPSSLLPDSSRNATKRKTPLKILSRLKPIHLHGDLGFNQGNQSNLFAFINKIKSNPDLHDDFWYFNRGESPYDLILASFLKKNPDDYYTLSYRGIAHYNKGEVNFLTLEDWEREAYLYKKFKMIPFFAKYRKWKSFAIWMKRRRATMMEEVKLILERNLPFLDSDLQEGFLSMRQKCATLSKLDILDLPVDKTRTLHEFNDDQRSKAVMRSNDIKFIEDSLLEKLKLVCSGSTDKFIRSNITGSILDKEETLTAKDLPHTHEAVIRSHLQHLGKFIRLLDYMLIHAKVCFCTNVFAKLYNYAAMKSYDKSGRRSKGILYMDSVFNVTGVGFSPEMHNVKRSFKKAAERAEKTIFERPFFAEAYDFSKYVKSLAEFEETPLVSDIDPIIISRNNNEIAEFQEKIVLALESYSEKIKSFGQTWLGHLKTYQANKSFKISKLRKYDIDNLNRIIIRYKKQIETFNNLPEYVEIDIFKVNLQPLKSKLLPSSLECIEKIKKFLPEFANENATAILKELIFNNKILSFAPGSIHEYIDHSDKIKQIEDKSESLALRVLNLKDFVELLQTHLMTISQDLKEKNSEISRNYDKMRTSLNFICMRAEQTKFKFTKILKMEIKQVNGKLEKIVKMLRNDKFSNKTSFPKIVVELLKEASLDVNDLYVDTRNFISYQDILGLPRSNFSGVDAAKETYELLFIMWNGIYNWDIKVKNWSLLPIDRINADDLSLQTEKYHKKALKSLKLEENGNFVGRHFMDLVKRIRDYVPIIKDILCPAFKPRHFKAIQDLLGNSMQIYSGTYTFYELIQSSISDYKDQISRVAQSAIKEAELEDKLKILLQPLQKYDPDSKFEIDKDLHTYSEVVAFKNLLQKTQSNLDNIIEEDHSEPLKGTIDKWKKRLSILYDTMY